ncbi:MAG: FAD binding domain-containing protein [Sphaerochaetaceae bacterium]|jgi:CO/xanthine dehydrogenase FAD-binding subunit|nr:FAD binding domain-containing protein [Sphaerochaetaceae bacterium]MDX9939679.1 FAD binding domain-containing protein [Sphaerochaetaceae bacterium]
MIARFDYHVPASLDEACALKKEYGNTGIVVAGGSDVYAKMHLGDHLYDHVIDIKKIEDMQGIRWSETEGLSLGAAVTHHEIERHPVIKERYDVLVQGVRTIGSLQVRNRGTIGGNICTAAPSADGIGPLLVLDASCVIHGLGGERTVPLKDFFTGPKQTVLADDEVLVRVTVPTPAPSYGGAYFKYGRRNAMEIALLGISVYLEVADDGKTCSAMRIALGTSAPIPIRAQKTEAYYIGKDLSDRQVVEAASSIILEDASPRNSWRADGEFRRSLLKLLVPRTVRTAYGALTRE